MKKGEVIPDNMAPKSYFPLSRTTIRTLSTNSGTKLRAEKIASRRVSSLASWIADKYLKKARNFPRNKSKIKRKSTTEILPSLTTERKFNREIGWKELYGRLESKWILKHFDKTKKKRKILKFKELCFPDILFDKFAQIVQNLQHFIFSISFFLVPLYEITFEKLIVLSFRISIRTRKLRDLLFKLTIWTYRLKLHTKTPYNMTQLNTKFGFSVISFISILFSLKFF